MPITAVCVSVKCSPESIQTWPVVYRNEELPFRREVVAYFKTLNHPSLSSAEVTVLLPNSAGPKCVHFLLRSAQSQYFANPRPLIITLDVQVSDVMRGYIKLSKEKSIKEFFFSPSFWCTHVVFCCYLPSGVGRRVQVDWLL